MKRMLSRPSSGPVGRGGVSGLRTCGEEGGGAMVCGPGGVVGEW